MMKELTGFIFSIFDSRPEFHLHGTFLWLLYSIHLILFYSKRLC